MKRKKSHTPRFAQTLCLTLLIVGSFLTEGFSQRYPVTVNFQVIPPYSTNLEKYAEAGNDRMIATLVFNDFSQSSWTVKLRLTIESGHVRLRSNPDAPINAITLTPGVPEQLSGFDLGEYLNYNNMLVSGIAREEVARGGLPDGLYTFVLEAVDARTGVVISNRAETTAWLLLNDPPQITFPLCGERIRLADPQNIAFQWLPMHTGSPNSSFNTQYEFTLVEVPEGLNANEAILSGMPVLTTVVPSNVFLYGATEPLLENGKTYAFRIRALDDQNLSLFKNDGYSQVCWFVYGFATNGLITSTLPADGSTVNPDSQPVFAWMAPGNLNGGQQFNYQLKIFELGPGQNPEDVVQTDLHWHEEEFPSTSSLAGHSKRLEELLEPEKDYAWQVKAFSEGIEIAASRPGRFSVSPVIDRFLAGSHVIKIVAVSNPDLENFAGRGKVKLLDDGTEFEIEFSGLSIVSSAGKLFISKGEINYELPETFPVTELSPTEKQNGSAYFYPKAVKLDREGMDILGTVRWDLPFPQLSGEKAVVKTADVWINYDLLALNGYAALDESNNYDLLDPAGFRLELAARTSNFFLRQNEYTQNFDGQILAPSNVQGKNGNRVSYSFRQLHQLYYNTIPDIAFNEPVRPVKNLNLFVEPRVVHLDLSESVSPDELSDNTSWKGLYAEKFDVVYESRLDALQVLLDNSVRHSFSSDAYTASINEGGVQFTLRDELNETENKGRLNTFKGTFQNIAVVVTDSELREGSATGVISIPFLNPDKEFKYIIPMNDQGLMPAYLDDAINNSEYTFNAGAGEQEVLITVSQAVFENNDRLGLAVDVAWPGLDARMNGLQGLKIWGNNLVGFHSPNGKITLDEMVAGTLKEFPVTVNALGCGYYEGNYFFTSTATIILSDDIAGQNGPPQVDFYSKADSRLAQEDIELTAVALGEVLKAKTSGSFSGEVNYRLLGKSSYQSGDMLVDSLFIKLDVMVGTAEGFLKLTHNDPDWGNSWQGSLKATLRVPAEIRANVLFVTGRRNDGLGYWFYEGGLATGGTDEDNKNLNIANRAGANTHGENIHAGSKRKFKVLNKIRDGFRWGPVSIVGLDFRAYHHMSRTGDSPAEESNSDALGITEINVSGGAAGTEFTFLPDENIDYGFYGRVALIDAETQGQALSIDAAVEVQIAPANVKYALEGTMEIGASTGRGLTASGKFYHNPAESHIIGDLWIVVETETVCAEGGLAFEIKGSDWKIALGNQTRKILFITGCNGWGATGWLRFSPYNAELGIGVAFNASAESPWLGPPFASFRPKVDFGFTAGIMAAATLNPKFSIDKAGLWAEVWGSIYCDYRFIGASGTWVIASARLSGDLVMYFPPVYSTSIEGQLHGEIEVIGFSAQFDTDFRHTF